MSEDGMCWQCYCADRGADRCICPCHNTARRERDR